ncbi:MAG: hypothetical protein GY882_01550 [Actinomycetia bacterium]|nr:hypothetical protein [Actinomycetes bacterium]MCP4845073.1 hypothetical protein [Actinomycetes bacterium]
MAVTLVQEPESISRLRGSATEGDWADSFSVDDVQEVIGLLECVTPRDTIAKELGKSPEAVEQLVKTFGTWVAHTKKGSKVPAFKFNKQSSDSQLSLIQPDNLLGLERKRGVGTIVTIPLGFDRASGSGSQCEQSIARLLFERPDKELTTRFLARVQSANAAPVISGRDVFILWQFDRVGRLHEMDEVSDAKTFAQRMVQAWDVAADHLERSAKAAGVIATFNLGKGRLKRLLNAVETVTWVNEARMTRLAEAVTAASEGGEFAARNLESEMRSVRRDIKATPEAYVPRSLRHLNDGQILRLIEAVGLGHDEDQRHVENDIRDRLVDLGLRRDLDLLLPIGIEAGRAGCLDAFWAAVDEFAAGIPEWRANLDEALGLVAA